MTLPQPFGSYQTDQWHDVKGYSFMINFANYYFLLGVPGTRWHDPGRLWEVNMVGLLTAYAGHVLSKDGKDASDQARCGGDKYFVYGRTAVGTCSGNHYFWGGGF